MVTQRGTCRLAVTEGFVVYRGSLAFGKSYWFFRCLFNQGLVLEFEPFVYGCCRRIGRVIGVNIPVPGQFAIVLAIQNLADQINSALNPTPHQPTS